MSPERLTVSSSALALHEHESFELFAKFMLEQIAEEPGAHGSSARSATATLTAGWKAKVRSGVNRRRPSQALQHVRLR